ncbi:MAG: NAD(P)/FAD-dependent oxidoreductase [Chloroflexi bacterium]|nr:NAD(P)/FAD-dependent oxidoreductase [Chloroflexota bacterium]
MRIIVLGAGFGGLMAALELERRLRREPEIEVALIDRHPYHLFTPMLFQVVAGEVEPGHIAYPLRWLMRGKKLKFYEREIRHIDLANKKVLLDDAELDYDYLVMGLGSITNFFGVPKAESNAFPVKSLREAMAIKHRIIDAFGQAEAEPRPEVRRRLLSFSVVGGGATGVELVASLHDLFHQVLSRDYPRINPNEVSLFLAEASFSLLAGMDPGMGQITLKKLRVKGVDIHMGCRIVGIDEGGIHTADAAFFPCHTVIWATGIRPNPLTEPLPVLKAKDGRIIVQDTLEAPQWPGVYIVGDIACFLNKATETPLPCKAAVAAQEGRAAAQNILRSLRGLDTLPFHYRYEGDLVALGRNASVARVARRCFDGFPAWFLWRIVHLQKLPGFRNRVSVALDWTFDYLLRRDTMRLE